MLDWGRGVWTYENTWYWSSAAYVLPSGTPFGWNLGYGFGDTSAASENMLFHAGTAHKLGGIKFEIPRRSRGKRAPIPSHGSSRLTTGASEADFAPVLDRASCADVKLIKSDQHQVFGRFTGKAVLDNGTVVEFADFPGFAEKVSNKW